MHPPEQAVHPLKNFSIKKQYLSHSGSTISMNIMLMVLFRACPCHRKTLCQAPLSQRKPELR